MLVHGLQLINFYILLQSVSEVSCFVVSAVQEHFGEKWKGLYELTNAGYDNVVCVLCRVWSMSISEPMVWV